MITKNKNSFLFKKDENISEYGLISNTLDSYFLIKEEDGWIFVESIGSGLIFKSGEVKLYVSTEMLTRRYIRINE